MTQVNGQSTASLTHKEVIEILKKVEVGKDVVITVVSENEIVC